jgi:1-acyl-sn-glycerol-3-phosphate acyltransferase
MEKPFLDNRYETSPVRRSFMDYLFLGSRWWYSATTLNVICRCARFSKKGKLTREEFIKIGLANMKCVENAGGYVNIENLAALEKTEGPVVVIGNHMSMLETLVLPGIVNPYHEATYVIKKSLAEYPVLKHTMKAIRGIKVSRENPREDFKVVMKEGKQLLQEGISIIIFPQSTRSVEFQPEIFNSIGIKLAKSMKVPVIPLALKTDFLENGTIMKDFGPIHRKRKVFFHFGEPMEISGNGKDEHQKIVDFIQQKLEEFAQY